MSDASNLSLTGRHKALLLGGLIVAVAAAAALVVLRPGPACSGIVEQTAPRLEANVELIRNKGGIVVSQDTVQELSDGAQKVGLHLKTCCSVLEGGTLNPDQFQQCIERASAYERQVAAVAEEVERAASAQQKGDTRVVEQKVQHIRLQVQNAASAIAGLEQHVARLAPATPQSASAGPRSASEQEPNDTKNSAAEIRANTEVNGAIASTEDADHFVFVSGKAVRDRVVVTLENRSETLRPSLTLFGPDKAQMLEAYNRTPGADTRFTFTAEPETRYIVKVNPYGTSGAYTLSAVPQNAHDRFEPNDNPARHAPTPLAPGVAADASILDASDNDWYLLRSAPGTTLRLRLENRSATLRPSVVVYDARRSQLHNPYDSTPGASLDFSFATTPGAAYHLQVSPYGTHGAYRLTVR